MDHKFFFVCLNWKLVSQSTQRLFHSFSQRLNSKFNMRNVLPNEFQQIIDSQLLFRSLHLIRQQTNKNLLIFSQICIEYVYNNCNLLVVFATKFVFFSVYLLWFDAWIIWCAGIYYFSWLILNSTLKTFTFFVCLFHL